MLKYQGNFLVEQERQDGEGNLQKEVVVELSFLLQLEWMFGKYCKAGKIIPLLFSL